MNILATSRELEGAPVEFPIFAYGESELEGYPPTRFLVDEKSMDTIISNFTRRGNDMVIDYEHQSLKDEQAPAAGWISKLMNRGQEGLWAAVNWTQKAKQYLENREYRYFSPVFHIRKADQKVVKLINIALTNSPRTNSIKPIIAKAGYRIISADQRRLNEMMGIDDEFWEAAGYLPDQVKLFETAEEIIQRQLSI